MYLQITFRTYFTLEDAGLLNSAFCNKTKKLKKSLAIKKIDALLFARREEPFNTRVGVLFRSRTKKANNPEDGARNGK